MPLMGSFYVGLSGLQTSQNALNTTAHNLTNINTEGYTRQQSLQATRRYNVLSKHYESVSDQQYGLGTLYAAVRQVRDVFVDKTLRKESGRNAFYDVQAAALEEVEDLLGEMQGEAFQNSVADLWTAVQELAKDPSSSVTQGLLVQRCSSFLDRAVSVYNQLSSYQDNLNRQVKDMVDHINDIGKKIQSLNDEIRFIECAKTEHANDLRDTRNKLIDELADYCSIEYHEEADTTVTIQIEGVDFIKTDRFFEIGLKVDGTTGFYTPFWPQNASYTVLENGQKDYNIDGAEVFDLLRAISSDLDTDIGSLKSTLLARGNRRADYTDLADEKNYDIDVAQSVCMNIEAEFDQLVHNVATKINDIMASTGYMVDDDTSPLQMFKKITSDGYVSDGAGGWIYVPEDPEVTDTLYCCKNLYINDTLIQNPSKLKFKTVDESVDYDTAEALKAAFTEEIYTLNPNVKKTTTFNDYYTDLVAQVANSGSVYRSIQLNQENTVESCANAREQIVGVSSDEELSNMIKFQNAYNASSRYINVVSEMLEHLINKLG